MGGFHTGLQWLSGLAAVGSSQEVGLLARYLLAVSFGLAATFKFRQPNYAARAMVEFGVARQIRVRNGLFVGGLEAVIAIGLLVDQSALVASIGAGIMSLAFVVLILRALSARRRFPCGCFSTNEEAMDGWTAARSGAFLACALISTADAIPAITYPPLTQRPTYVLSAIGVVGIVALVSLGGRVWRTSRRLELALDWEWILQSHARLATPLKELT